MQKVTETDFWSKLHFWAFQAVQNRPFCPILKISSYFWLQFVPKRASYGYKSHCTIAFVSLELTEREFRVKFFLTTPQKKKFVHFFYFFGPKRLFRPYFLIFCSLSLKATQQMNQHIQRQALLWLSYGRKRHFLAQKGQKIEILKFDPKIDFFEKSKKTFFPSLGEYIYKFSSF